jgi:hypothetical protein
MACPCVCLCSESVHSNLYRLQLAPYLATIRLAKSDGPDSILYPIPEESERPVPPVFFDQS